MGRRRWCEDAVVFQGCISAVCGLLGVVVWSLDVVNDTYTFVLKYRQGSDVNWEYSACAATLLITVMTTFNPCKQTSLAVELRHASDATGTEMNRTQTCLHGGRCSLTPRRHTLSSLSAISISSLSNLVCFGADDHWQFPPPRVLKVPPLSRVYEPLYLILVGSCHISASG